MSERAMQIAQDYMQEIDPKFESSVLKILYAYREQSKLD